MLVSLANSRHRAVAVHGKWALSGNFQFDRHSGQRHLLCLSHRALYLCMKINSITTAASIPVLPARHSIHLFAFVCCFLLSLVPLLPPICPLLVSEIDSGHSGVVVQSASRSAKSFSAQTVSNIRRCPRHYVWRCTEKASQSICCYERKRVAFRLRKRPVMVAAF